MKQPGQVQAPGLNVGLPQWASGWGATCQVRGHGFSPWPRKIPDAAANPCTTATEPVFQSHGLQQEKRHKKPTPQRENSPHCTQLEKDFTQQRRPSTAKSKQVKNFKTIQHTQLKQQHIYIYIFVSVQFSLSVMSDSLRPHGLQHVRPPCPSPTPGVYPNSCPSSQ